MILNRHQRLLSLPVAQAGVLLDSLASAHDNLWPKQWPPMRLDRPLQVGARGGHGPIRYFVELYEPGRRVRFRFTSPPAFQGFHELRVESAGEQRCRIIHELEMLPTLRGWLLWVLVFGPLHDALIEDALDRAEQRQTVSWSYRVRLLRSLLKVVLSRPGRFHSRGVPEPVDPLASGIPPLT